MPRLILLNGPPAVGKSTLARRYAADHPLAFCLDLDVFRRLIGCWDAHPVESGLLARRMAAAMAAEHLRSGHDVIVPQYLGRSDFIDELEGVASGTSSQFHEIVLLDAREAVLARFRARADDPDLATHHAEAAQMIAGDGGLAEMHERLLALLAHRPRARVVTTTAGDVEGAYRSVLAAL